MHTVCAFYGPTLWVDFIAQGSSLLCLEREYGAYLAYVQSCFKV